MLSLWESKWFFDYDTVIIGSGIVGLSTAAAILEIDPHHKVLILERGIIPAGASTRNAGFACFGSLTEILDDINLMGEKTSYELVEMRYRGILKLRARLGDKDLDFKEQGGYEIITEQQLPKLAKMQDVNDLLRPIFKDDVFYLANSKIEEFGFNKDIVKALVFNKYEGQIDSGKGMLSLLLHVQKLGAKIITGADVSNYQKDNQGRVAIEVKNPLNHTEPHKFMSKKLVICTNAFTESLVKDLDIYPARGQVVVTTPIKNLKAKGIFHYEGGYYYFRDYYGRIVLGGGRNLDFKGETTTELKTTTKITDILEKLLREVILPGVQFEIEYKWAGIMCFGYRSKAPIVTELEKNIYTAVRMSGMGVALSSQVADVIRNLVLSKHQGESIPIPRL